MVYKITLLKLILILLLTFILFEIIGHIHELILIDQNYPYYEYLQTPVVRFFYWLMTILLLIYFIFIIYIYIRDLFYLSNFLKYSLLFISVLITLIVLLKNRYTESIENQPYFIDKSIKGMAHYLGFIPALVLLLFSIMFLVLRNRKI